MTPVFSFDTYELNGSELSFIYSYFDGDNKLGTFRERYILPIELAGDDSLTNYILQQLHIIVGVSYYKSLLGDIRLPYQLTEDEAAYWNTVYDNGLAEYAFVNQLTGPIKPFSGSGEAQSHEAVSLPDHRGIVLGVGGGKDSIVAGEIFKSLGLDTTAVDMSTGDNEGQAGEVIKRMSLPSWQVQRFFDTTLIDFTRQYDGKNGHIPLSAILAWLGILLAYSGGKQYVAMANEAAASTGNVQWNDKEVNHQWSKSYEFEGLTQEFLTKHISADLSYFSPIRPYGSLAVMELFIKLGRPYYQSFTSCNNVLRIDPAERPNGRWCTRCAKCLSTWLLLSPWLTTDQLTEIFGRNLYEDASLQPLLLQLIGLSGHKPLDCVGTIEELRAVSRLILQQQPGLPLFTGIKTEVIPGPSVDKLIHELHPHHLPAAIGDSVLDFVKQNL
jgi:hypothetical protein